MKGVILAGGRGTRLQPITKVTNKHMVPILNRPMILYPIDTLKFFGITDILIVSGGDHIGDFADFLGDGSEYGINLTYRVQKEAGGIAQALALAEDFAAGEQIMVILGDNIFRNEALPQLRLDDDQSAIFCTTYVDDVRRFGVLRTPIVHQIAYGIVEKPERAMPGDSVVTGLYIYPNDVFSVIKTLVPSGRGELEITDVNNFYLKKFRCSVNNLDGEAFWSDAGTPESLYKAIKYVAQREGYELSP